MSKNKEKCIKWKNADFYLFYTLAFAGIAVGDQLEVFKKLSWKIVIVSFVVMASTYFGSAAISNIILSLKGMI